MMDVSTPRVSSTEAIYISPSGGSCLLSSTLSCGGWTSETFMVTPPCAVSFFRHGDRDRRAEIGQRRLQHAVAQRPLVAARIVDELVVGPISVLDLHGALNGTVEEETMSFRECIVEADVVNRTCASEADRRRSDDRITTSEPKYNLSARTRPRVSPSDGPKAPDPRRSRPRSCNRACIPVRTRWKAAGPRSPCRVDAVSAAQLFRELLRDTVYGHRIRRHRLINGVPIARLRVNLERRQENEPTRGSRSASRGAC